MNPIEARAARRFTFLNQEWRRVFGPHVIPPSKRAIWKWLPDVDDHDLAEAVSATKRYCRGTSPYALHKYVCVVIRNKAKR